MHLRLCSMLTMRGFAVTSLDVSLGVVGDLRLVDALGRRTISFYRVWQGCYVMTGGSCLEALHGCCVQTGVQSSGAQSGVVSVVVSIVSYLRLSF
jgi:hypothetical protein